MFKVCGSNIHGQWFLPDPVLKTFQTVDTPTTCRLENIDLSKAKLCALTWSYNIMLYEGNYYVVGSWLGNESSLVCIELPKLNEEVLNCVPPHFIIVGNDNRLVILSKKTLDMWVLDFATFDSWNWSHKTIIFQEDEHESERLKKSRNIVKAILTRTSLLILTSEGKLFENLVEVITHQCIGKITDMVSGYEHIVILTDAGYVYSWGSGRRCQLGLGDLKNQNEPTNVEGLAGIKIKKISAGGWHTLAVSEHGDLYAWGWNDTGQLGLPKTKENDCSLQSQCVPVFVDLYENDNILEVNVKDISCGSKHSAIILEDNSVWVTGSNKYGQLGLSTDIEMSPSFVKMCECNANSVLLCGIWCTVLINA